MLLAVDVGNTNMVFGVFEQDKLMGNFRLMTDTNRTSDEIGLMIWNYFQRMNWSTEEVEDVIIASVVPQVMHTLCNAMVNYLKKKPIIVDDDVDAGLPYGVRDDERLGPDRSVACLAAIKKYGTPLIVLDFGTATTLDGVNEKGEYMGGCISAGMRISADALFTKTAMLPKVELAKPDQVLGCTAVGQIQSGAVTGYVGAMEYLIRGAKEELAPGKPVRVVATGGLARLVADHTDMIDDVDSGLILDGLCLIYKRYQSENK